MTHPLDALKDTRFVVTQEDKQYRNGYNAALEEVKRDFVCIRKSDVPEGLADAVKYYTPEKIATKHSRGQTVLKAGALLAQQGEKK